MKIFIKQIRIYLKLLKNYKKIAQKKSLYFYIFSMPVFGFFLALVPKIIVKTESKFLTNLLLEKTIFKSTIRFLSPKEINFISKTLDAYNALDVNKINNSNIDNNTKNKLNQLKENGFCNLGKIFSDQECDDFIQMLRNKNCFNSQAPMQSDGRVLEFKPEKEIFSGSLFSYFSFNPETTLSFVPLQNFLANKKLHFLINSYLNFEWKIYSCITWYNPTSKEEHYVHRTHRDYDDYKALGINIYWNKVSKNNGALSFVKKSHNSETSIEQKDLLIGEKGQVYLVDYFGLHAGNQVTNNFRYTTTIRVGKYLNYATVVNGFSISPSEK